MNNGNVPAGLSSQRSNEYVYNSKQLSIKKGFSCSAAPFTPKDTKGIHGAGQTMTVIQWHYGNVWEVDKINWVNITQPYIFDHYIFDILGKTELPLQTQRNHLCFRQLLRICSRGPCPEQRRHAGDLGVTHYCRMDGVGSTSHTSWMRNLAWSVAHLSGLSALVKVPCGVIPFQALVLSTYSIMSSRLSTDGIFLEGIIAVD